MCGKTQNIVWIKGQIEEGKNVFSHVAALVWCGCDTLSASQVCDADKASANILPQPPSMHTNNTAANTDKPQQQKYKAGGVYC